MSPAIPDGPSKLLNERVRALFRNLPRAMAGHDEPVHQIRVAARRLRVVLPLLTAKPEGRRVRRVMQMMRSLTRAAGRSRDLDVIVGLFEEVAGERARAVPEVKLLRRRLRAARSRSRVLMADELLDLEIAMMRRDLRRLLVQEPEALFAIYARLRRVRDLRGRALLSEMQALGERFDPVALHDQRRQVRRLRYAAEVGAALHDEPSDAPKRFKALQEQLGRIHDEVVLSEWLGRQAAAAQRKGHFELVAAAQQLSNEFLDRARALHQEYLDGAPSVAVRKALAVMGRAESAA